MEHNNQHRSLFPAYQKATPALFPAYNNSSQDAVYTKPETDEAHKWLENKSFVSALEKNLLTENKEDCIVIDSIGDPEETKRDKDKRTSSDSDQKSGYPTKKRKRHKHHHKHKGNQRLKEPRKKHKKSRLKTSSVIDLDDSQPSTSVEIKENEIDQQQNKPFFEANKGKIFIDDMPDLAPEHAFRVDRESDDNNWTYKSLYKLHIAKYRHYWHSCLGLSYKQRMNWREGESHARRKDRLDQERYYGKLATSVLRKAMKFQKAQLAVSKDIEIPVLTDYISLGTSDCELVPHPESCKNADSLNIYDVGTSLYVQGKGKPIEQSDSTIDDFVRDEMLQRTEYYNKSLRDNPGNVQLWLEYVNFQDKLTVTQQMKTSGASSVTSLSQIKIKLAILDKAILANPASVVLKIARIDLGSGSWDREKVLKDWDNLLFVHSGNVDVWKQYLVFIQSYLPTFSVTHTIKSYHRCVKMLRMIQEGKVHTHDVCADLESDMLEIFVQYCTLLCHSGHTEKAMATFQALVEFNLYVPSSFSHVQYEERAAIFEAFWDSGVARFGEKDAQGWKVWLEKREMDLQHPSESGLDLDCESAEEAILNRSLDKWKTWLELEAYRECQHVLPWRPDAASGQTEEDCEDTDRLVLVDDVTPSLFVIGQLSVKCQLILSMINFLGVCVHDHDLIQDIENSTSPRPAAHMIDNLHQIEYRNFNHNHDYKTVLNNHMLDAPRSKEFVRHILRQSISFFADDKAFQTSLTLTLITYEFQTLLHQSDNTNAKLDKHKAKDLRKLVKSLLKEAHNRNNLLIYALYAKVESRIGKIVDACGIIETLLSMQQPNVFLNESDIHSQTAVCILYHTYVAIVLGLQDNMFTKSLNGYDASELKAMFAKSAQVLTCLADGGKLVKSSEHTSVASIDILRTRKKFRVLCDDVQNKVLECDSESSLQMCCALLLEVSICFAVYEYCISGDLSNAEIELRSVEHFCEKNMCSVCVIANSRQCYHNLRNNVLKFLFKLTKFHQSISVCPLSKLRLLLTTALDQFPEDMYFLQEYVALENQTFTIGGVRRYFNKTIHPGMNSALPAIYAILSEITRHSVLSQYTEDDGNAECVLPCTGLTHRIRALFERCLMIPACQHCVLIWRMYAQFEMKHGDKNRTEGVFYRSLQQCPWAKVLYRDAVSMFPERLQELVDMMLEKDIRVQIPVEEIDILQEGLEQADSNIQETDPQDDDGLHETI